MYSPCSTWSLTDSALDVGSLICRHGTSPPPPRATSMCAHPTHADLPVERLWRAWPSSCPVRRPVRSGACKFTKCSRKKGEWCGPKRKVIMRADRHYPRCSRPMVGNDTNAESPPSSLLVRGVDRRRSARVLTKRCLPPAAKNCWRALLSLLVRGVDRGRSARTLTKRCLPPAAKNCWRAPLSLLVRGVDRARSPTGA
jgi:hypothetical protein